MIKTILLDLDGVLVDFVGAACLVHRWDAAKVVEYDFFKTFGKTDAEFWQPIDARGEDWWASLPAHNWAARLIDTVRRNGNLVIATSPSRHHGSAAGKVRWLQRVFGNSFRNYMLGPSKHLMANQETVLIDDSETQCAAFAAAGGTACLFPQPWNRLGQIPDPVAYVENFLKGIT